MLQLCCLMGLGTIEEVLSYHNQRSPSSTLRYTRSRESNLQMNSLRLSIQGYQPTSNSINQSKRSSMLPSMSLISINSLFPSIYSRIDSMVSGFKNKVVQFEPVMRSVRKLMIRMAPLLLVLVGVFIGSRVVEAASADSMIKGDIIYHSNSHFLVLIAAYFTMRIYERIIYTGELLINIFQSLLTLSINH